MRTLKTGDIFRGSSYVDLINRAIGTNFNSCFRCLIEMNEFVNCCGLTSWFVFMNGDVHGSYFDWKWKNFLSKDEKEIKEYHVGDDIKLLNETRGKTGFYPFRLAFQLDPYENGSRNCCKFLGLFMLKEFLKEDSISSECSLKPFAQMELIYIKYFLLQHILLKVASMYQMIYPIFHALFLLCLIFDPTSQLLFP